MPHRTLALLLIVCLFASPLFADQANAPVSRDMPQDYRIVPGDGLEVSVWKEDGMNSKLLVRPDCSGPLSQDSFRPNLRG
jgi:hypothetical protein